MLLNLLISIPLLFNSGITTNNPHQDFQNINELELSEGGKKYAVVASTKGMFDYAVNCRVEATCFGSDCSVQYVEVATSYGYKRVSHTSWDGEYSFNYEGYTYYFRF